MLELFAPYDFSAASERISPRVDACLSKILEIQVPQRESMRASIVFDIASYIEELFRCHGQESRGAREYLWNLHSNIGFMISAGVMSDNAHENIDEVFFDAVCDEMRRCGIGKIFGFFSDYVEIQKSFPHFPNLAALQEEAEREARAWQNHG